MGALSRVLRLGSDNRMLFRCPGCEEVHQVPVGSGAPPRWGYNGNPNVPTFTPSILIRGVKLDMPDAELDRILAEYTLPEDRERMLADKRINTVCHSFVTDGKIQFLGDCTHKLAGQTVPLPDFDA
jgi:hypothetical protein